MLADGEMSPVTVSMSLMTSFISAVTILGTSSEGICLTFIDKE